jgi:hypothetical protein
MKIAQPGYIEPREKRFDVPVIMLHLAHADMHDQGVLKKNTLPAFAASAK